jgi:pyrroloquinoline quinone (PQQ) biosynthesis protein C
MAEAATAGFPTFESFKSWFEEKTSSHPFKTGERMGRFYDDFFQGKVAVEFLREYACQYYIFIQLTNANVTWALLNHVDLWRRHPDLYNIVAAKIGSELCDPAPGGHGRTYIKYAQYLGLKREDLLFARPIPEIEIQFNTALAYRTQRPAQTAVRWMLEGFVGYFVKRWRDTLRDRYGFPDDVLEYFDLHIAADLGEHGPEGEMLLKKLYGLGLVEEADYPGMLLQVERAVAGTRPGSQTFSWQEVLYERYTLNSLQSHGAN